jgi:hypothetical protein
MCVVHTSLERSRCRRAIFAVPPAPDYQRKFWKNVITVLEGKNLASDLDSAVCPTSDAPYIVRKSKTKYTSILSAR